MFYVCAIGFCVFWIIITITWFENVMIVRVLIPSILLHTIGAIMTASDSDHDSRGPEKRLEMAAGLLIFPSIPGLLLVVVFVIPWSIIFSAFSTLFFLMIAIPFQILISFVPFVTNVVNILLFTFFIKYAYDELK